MKVFEFILPIWVFKIDEDGIQLKSEDGNLIIDKNGIKGKTEEVKVKIDSNGIEIKSDKN